MEQLQIRSDFKNNTLNYLIDSTLSKVSRLVVLSFENENDKASFSKYLKPTVEIKNYNVVIDSRVF